MKNRQLKYFYLSILLVCTVFGTSLSQKIVSFAEEETEVVVSDEVGSPGVLDSSLGDLDSSPGDLDSTQGDLDSTLGELGSTQGTGDSGSATGGTGDGGSALLGGPEVTGGTDGEAEEETAIMQIEEEPVALMAAPMMSARLAAAPTTSAPTTSATTESADLALAASPAAAIPSGLNETQETYSVPSGSVTIQGIGETYTNDSTSNAIQKAVEKAIQYATVNTSHTSTIVVKNGTYEGGLTIDTTEKSSLGQLLAGYISEAVAGGGSVTKEDIVLRIIAEDIIGENGSLLENTY